MQIPSRHLDVLLHQQLHRRALRRYLQKAARPWCSLQAWVDVGLQRLCPSQRAALILCDLELRPLGEAASLLGWSRGLVLAHWRAARKQLRCWLARRGIIVSRHGLGRTLRLAVRPEGEARRLASSVLAHVAGEAPLPPRVSVLVELVGGEADGQIA